MIASDPVRLRYKSILIVPNHSMFADESKPPRYMAVKANELSVIKGLMTYYRKIIMATYSLGVPEEAGELPKLECSLAIQCESLGLWRPGTRTLQKVCLHLRSFRKLLTLSRLVDDIYIYVPNTFGTLFAFALVVLRRPFALYVRGGLENQGILGRFTYRILVRSARFCLCTGEWLRKLAASWGGTADLVSPMMPYRENDAPAHIRPAGTPLRLLFVGAMIESKGVFDLLRIAGALKRRDVRFVMSLAGSGNEGEIDRFRTTATALGVSDVVNYRGFIAHREDLRNLYIEHDVFIFPSLYNEGFPRVFLEAMLFGEYVITYRRAQYEGLLIDGVNSVLASPGEIDEIVDAIACHAVDIQRLDRMRKGAQEHAKIYLRRFGDSQHHDQIASRFSAGAPESQSTAVREL